MGIEVRNNFVEINDLHEKGVDTSVEANPTVDRFMGMPLLYVFRRNRRADRKDDGNPLMHALKARKGFSITAHWERRIMERAERILTKAAGDLQGYHHCLPIPSTSPFCGTFARLVSRVSGAPILEPSFLRKRRIGEVLAAIQANPPRVRAGLKGAYTSQLHTWQGLNPDADYQAKEVETKLRLLFEPFTLDGAAPDLTGKRVLLVDDLFATGSSLVAIRDILKGQLSAEVCGVCFLSGL